VSSSIWYVCAGCISPPRAGTAEAEPALELAPGRESAPELGLEPEFEPEPGLGLEPEPAPAAGALLFGRVFEPEPGLEPSLLALLFGALSLYGSLYFAFTAEQCSATRYVVTSLYAFRYPAEKPTIVHARRALSCSRYGVPARTPRALREENPRERSLSAR
jgi:hypothetical protein